jgi:hypothetical protein
VDRHKVCPLRCESLKQAGIEQTYVVPDRLNRRTGGVVRPERAWQRGRDPAGLRATVRAADEDPWLSIVSLVELMRIAERTTRSGVLEFVVSNGNATLFAKLTVSASAFLNVRYCMVLGVRVSTGEDSP